MELINKKVYKEVCGKDKPVRKNHVRHGFTVETKRNFRQRQGFAQFFDKNARHGYVPDSPFNVHEYAQNVRFGFPVRVKQTFDGRFKTFAPLCKRHRPAHGRAVVRGGADQFPCPKAR